MAYPTIPPRHRLAYESKKIPWSLIRSTTRGIACGSVNLRVAWRATNLIVLCLRVRNPIGGHLEGRHPAPVSLARKAPNEVCSGRAPIPVCLARNHPIAVCSSKCRIEVCSRTSKTNEDCFDNHPIEVYSSKEFVERILTPLRRNPMER